MARLDIMQMAGEIPRMLPRLLPNTAAQYAENVRLADGGLTPYRSANSVATVSGTPGQIKTIYKWLGNWYAWANVVNAAPGPVATDRLYYTGDSNPKMLTGGITYDLKLPTPATPTAALGGTATDPNVISIFYVRTWVTDFGEETVPSAASNTVNWQAGMSVTLSGLDAPPTGRAISKERFYRSQTSASGATALFFVAERAASNANWTDNVNLTDIGEELPSMYYTSPPDNLAGLISIPNGMMLGFVGKDLYFCEPWQPHAWPQSYILTMDYEIVALVYLNNMIVVLTTGQPYVVTGPSPDSMQAEKLQVHYPCVNAQGVVNLGNCVIYPSNDGLVLVPTYGLPSVITEQIITKPQWQQFNPQNLVAGQYDGKYMASYAYVDYNNNTISGTFILDTTGQMPFLSRESRKADACFFDITDGELYLLQGVNVMQFDAAGQVNEVMNWKSKKFFDAPRNYGCIFIQGNNGLTPEQTAARQAQYNSMQSANSTIFQQVSMEGEINGAAIGVKAIDDDDLQRVSVPSYILINVYADEQLVFSTSQMNQFIRMPSGFKAREWEVEVIGTASVEQITLATVAAELFQPDQQMQGGQ